MIGDETTMVARYVVLDDQISPERLASKLANLPVNAVFHGVEVVPDRPMNLIFMEPQ